LTTYTTSAVWFLFVFNVLFVGFLKRVSSYAVVILESKLAQQLSFGLVVGMICLLSWPILFLMKIIV